MLRDARPGNADDATAENEATCDQESDENTTSGDRVHAASLVSVRS